MRERKRKHYSKRKRVSGEKKKGREEKRGGVEAYEYQRRAGKKVKRANSC